MSLDNLPNENKSNKWKKVSSLLLAGFLISAAYAIMMQYNSDNVPARAAQDHVTNANNKPVAVSTFEEGSGNNNQTRKTITLVAQDAEVEIAPGKIVKVWTFNGTVPAPTLRFTEGENVTIKFINKTPIPHTIHFHGNHDDLNDGVHPQIMAGETYLYNITAAPAGALMYHCHAHPTSLHIRMGMYGALIVDPKNQTLLEPAREFVMVMGEYDTKNIMNFEAEYYPINGYADQYLQHPLQANHGEMVRMYVINIGTTIPYQFHLHSTVFKAYPSGLLSNQPIDAQTIPVGPGDASIIEARWQYPGTYLFHSHGIQEERGNMGQIVISEGNGTTESAATNASISMFDWQYQLQKSLQKPKIINYTQEELRGSAAPAPSQQGSIVHDNTTTFTQPTANATHSEIHQQQHGNNPDSDVEATAATPIEEISILKGAGSPSNGVFYGPSPAGVKKGSTVTWINNDSMPHTATSGNPDSGGQAPSGLFDTGIIGPGNSAQVTIDVSEGTHDYYCTLHPYMKGQLKVADG